jgi:nucleoside-diphosphate-sugar epimerase
VHLAITGIGGFIGLRMAQRAIALGWSVSGMDLSKAAAERAQALGADVFVGDINDGYVLEQTFAGADVVFHTAAVVAEDGPRELYERVNNQGTKNACKVAKAMHVRRFIHLSSVMVYGFNYPANVTEDGPFADDGNIYNETKLSSERIALGFNDESLAVTVIRPGDVYGLGSVPWVERPLAMIKAGQMLLPTVAGACGVINHVHVDNLIDGILLAMEKDTGAGVFTLTDDEATPVDEFFAYHAAMLGRRTPPKLPAKLALPVLKAAQAALPKMGIQLPFKADGIRFLCRANKVSCDKAKRELGYQPKINLTSGMQRLEEELRAARQL